MTTGRTTLNWWRFYADGYDLSGHSRSFGPLSCKFDEGIDDPVTETIKGMLPGNAEVMIGTLNGLFDNTAISGLHIVAKNPGVIRNVMIPVGIQAAPANNDPVFCGAFQQLGYYGEADKTPVLATIPFGNTSYGAGNLGFAQPWGTLLHAKAAEIAANTATGHDGGAASALGGFMMWQVFSGDGTATLSVQDAATNSNGSFAALLSSGEYDFSTPRAGIMALAKTATVRRYTRFQVAFNTATTITFALAFMRGTN